MNSVISAKPIAALAALVATLFSLGGTLGLADHYAQSGLGRENELAQNHAKLQTTSAASKPAAVLGKEVPKSKVG